MLINASKAPTVAPDSALASIYLRCHLGRHFRHTQTGAVFICVAVSYCLDGSEELYLDGPGGEFEVLSLDQLYTLFVAVRAEPPEWLRDQCVPRSKF